MRAIMSFIIAALLIATGQLAINDMQQCYALDATIIECDSAEDVVTCEDSTGNLWEFYGVEDWEPGTAVTLIMHTNGTESIYDDIITTVYRQEA